MVYLILIGALALILTLILFFLPLFYDSNIPLDLFFKGEYFSFAFGKTSFFLVLYDYLSEILKGSKKNYFFLYYSILVAFLFYFTSLGQQKSELIKAIKGEYIINTEDKMGKIITSDSENFYFGETNNYIFLFNNSKNQTTIINKSELVKITKTKK